MTKEQKIPKKLPPQRGTHWLKEKEGGNRGNKWPTLKPLYPKHPLHYGWSTYSSWEGLIYWAPVGHENRNQIKPAKRMTCISVPYTSQVQGFTWVASLSPRDPTWKERNGWKRSEQQLSCSRSYCKLLTLEKALYLELTKCGNTIVTGIRPKKFHGNYETVMQVECTKIFSSGGILKIHPKASQVKHVQLSITEIKIDGKNRGWGMVLKPEMLEQSSTWGHQER